ncbi:MAG: sugar phosphate isomerase/epimerase [Planctomycetes bacterium]|nr:sugar phosphate isomerase/epimerase [Planctomycetota bacterium]MCH9727870.1 sugar phosphate isomerase/epimerase [Planctomycetota bacterium]MCH9775462.1 sugar phosphate isomerase/epimerase [Planctomycetota bacterium]MCH9793128.1 sugar phosphate isomerase/epimerase [Planctomycetota bacterium]MDF1743520.1 sugar phosphate isomerase/epimerase [Gimesia sp.]
MLDQTNRFIDLRDQFSRRTFLKQASASLLAGSLIQPVSAIGAESAASSNGIKKAVKYQMILEKVSVLDKFKMLKDAGFDGTEMHYRTKVDPKEVKRASETTGVRVHGFINSDRDDLKDSIDQSKYYGGTTVLVVAGRVDQKNPYEVVYQQQQAKLRKNLPYAEKQGIKLLVENVWNNFLLSPLEMARFIDELESPAAGVYFDVGNVVRFGWPDQWIRILGPRIVKLDIKEYSRKKQKDEGLWKGFNVEINDGDCDWPAVRKALQEIGYTQGWATAEVKGGDRKRLQEISERMDRALALT